jgi:hypothetical protein
MYSSPNLRVDIPDKDKFADNIYAQVLVKQLQNNFATSDVVDFFNTRKTKK